MAKPSYRLDVNSHRGLPEWLLLHQAYSATFKALELILLPHSFTLPRLYAMGILASTDKPLTVSELSERMVREPHSLVRLVDELERLGWVKRSGDPSDRRRKPIRPTSEGLEAFQKAFPTAVALGQALMSELSDRQVAELGQYLRTLRDGALAELTKSAGGSRAIA